jgi:hypothetical protein
MSIKFNLVTAMQILIRKISAWLQRNNGPVSTWRLKRMTSFLTLVNPPKHARIIDLGGSDYFWNLIEHDFEVTILNLPGSQSIDFSNKSRYSYVEGDATDLSGLFADKSFDVVFSNSVIEHVGNEEKQANFAREVHRLADSYWIQTPSTLFPIEVHTGVPFYWKLPQLWRESLMNSWEKKLPAWSEMIKELRVLSKKDMIKLFPKSEIYIERKFLLEKSYTFYRPFLKKDN